ncbi:MAG: class I SAM-dependent methyltransferase [Methylococcales bacterium]
MEEKYSAASRYDFVCKMLQEHILGKERLAQAVSTAQRRLSTDRLSILELGCGTGLATEQLLKRVSRVQVLAIDDDAVRCYVAQDRIRIYKSDNAVEIRVADVMEYLEMSIQQGNFWDIVVSAFTFHNWTRTYRELVLKKIKQVLIPGGLFLNVDYYAPGGLWNAFAFIAHIKVLCFALIPCGEIKECIRWICHTIHDFATVRIMEEKANVHFLYRIGFNEIVVERFGPFEALVTAVKKGQ